jgi:hypothetical protein
VTAGSNVTAVPEELAPERGEHDAEQLGLTIDRVCYRSSSNDDP